MTAIFRYPAYALLVCALASCSGMFAKPKHAKPVKTNQVVDSGNYVKHLALGVLSPDDNGGSVEAVNAYAAQKAKNAKRQNVVIFDYKTSDSNNMQHIAAPVSASGGNGDLLDVMNQLSGEQYTLHNVRVATASIAPDKSLKLAGDDAQAGLSAQEQRLLDNTGKLAPLDDIRLQLRLITFFIQHRFRDAAYITVENAKQALAALPHENASDADTAKRLSQELEHAESDMRKTLPFNL